MIGFLIVTLKLTIPRNGGGIALLGTKKKLTTRIIRGIGGGTIYRAY